MERSKKMTATTSAPVAEDQSHPTAGPRQPQHRKRIEVLVDLNRECLRTARGGDVARPPAAA
jgi:hypothetical protein